MAGNAAQMVELLKALTSSQNQERQQAEKMFQHAKTSEPESLVLGLMQVLSGESAEEDVRRQASVLLRQLCTYGHSDKDFAFGKLNPSTKQQVAEQLLRLFETMQNKKLQQKVGDIVAMLAATTNQDDQKGWFAPGQRGWPTLLPTCFRLANPTQNQNASSCESAVLLLKDITEAYKKEISSAQAELGAVVQQTLAHSEIKVRCAAFNLVCELVGVLEKKVWAPLTATGNVLVQIIQQLCQNNMMEDLKDCMSNYIEVVTVEPDFFKQQLQSSMEPAKLMATLVKTKQCDSDIRSMAMEWLTQYCERKPKWLAKSLPNFPGLALECCMDLMLEIEDGDAALKEWAERMDDEEGEEDMDELHHNGEEAIDRIVEAIGMDTLGSSLFALVGNFSSQNHWQAKLAALTAVKQTVEYVEENEHINEMAKLLLQHMEHQHPRVRCKAVHALGQLANDQAPHFQDAWHATVMPKLLQQFDDPVDRVASMAMSAFVSFGEELDNALMAEYANAFMTKLVGRLNSSKHRMVLEESITSIAVIAGVIGKDFSQYYDGIMPLLKQLVLNAKGEKEARLRGKAFECLSLLGLAVGKEKFLPDAKEAIQQMLQSDMETDELLREYIKEASERICKCLKNDFAQFLPHLMPNVFKSLKLEMEEVGAGGVSAQDNDDTEYVQITANNGKLMKVKTTKFDELSQSVQLIQTYCDAMEGSFFDFIQPTAQALMPLMASSDEATLLCDEVRLDAYKAWAGLIKCANAGAKERNQGPAIANELLRTFLHRVVGSVLQNETEPETIKDAADGMARCFEAVEVGSIGGQEVTQLAQQLFTLLDASFVRQATKEKLLNEDKAATPAELQGDEDDENDENDEEECQRALEDAIGGLMKVAPQDFASQCLTECGKRLEGWLQSKSHRVLALYLGCDLLKNLKEASQPVWPVLMPAIFQGLGDQDPDVRIPCAYGIAWAAPLPAFAEAAPQAFSKLAQLIGGPAPKKRDEQAKIAMDNAVSALLVLAKNKAAQCPQDVPVWQLIINKLPLKADEEEAHRVHKIIVELLADQNPGLLGPDNSHLGKVLSILAEVYKQEDISTEEIDTGIANLFKLLPRDALMKCAASFTEKQQKKIEKMLS
mmetsp:Transcript_77073/g.160416  ORF Transcript_77073/g.160416 Transcript_77073/m.160416 type:complete len:1116 (+) Transcript_77073:170-3517(+)|eukprot:CAMPEP_0206468518 /NCGR_PEP_ID=MMETSP0324_2-20121206/29678_1 /ASSEMBLY_ACC=CAM_ASM_000836 /TAXON_ID=2866 /ORGANISM="Crypthecodinium cohnii, Strain Seligo" /LENGTH=1115 /DNA_ID=CAMNT_0053941993 /DNA_START=98 /DNA_END=3445 /DNA_ORIENTATION=-